jgi:hypothetical protein
MENLVKEVSKVIDPILDQLTGIVQKYGKWIVLFMVASIVYKYFKNK